MHITPVGERLPRLQIKFRISRSFQPRNLANLGSKIRFWIRQKEHTLNKPNSGWFLDFKDGQKNSWWREWSRNSR